MSKILVDTNILIYGIDQDSKFFSESRTILDSDHQLYTTSKNLVEFLTVVTRKSGYALESKFALDIVDEIVSSLTVFYPTSKSMAIFRDLVERYQPTGLKLHDFEIISIGLSEGISTIATFNKKDFKNVEEVSLTEF